VDWALSTLAGRPATPVGRGQVGSRPARCADPRGWQGSRRSLRRPRRCHDRLAARSVGSRGCAARGFWEPRPAQAVLGQRGGAGAGPIRPAAGGGAASKRCRTMSLGCLGRRLLRGRTYWTPELDLGSVDFGFLACDGVLSVSGLDGDFCALAGDPEMGVLDVDGDDVAGVGAADSKSLARQIAVTGLKSSDTQQRLSQKTWLSTDSCQSPSRVGGRAPPSQVWPLKCADVTSRRDGRAPRVRFRQ
jgi:hypothetical protein